MKSTKALLIFLGWQASVSICYGIDPIHLDAKTGLFTATDQSMPIVTAKYVGWLENWQWAGAKIKPQSSATANPNGFSHTGQAKKLDIDFTSTTTVDNAKAEWSYQWNKLADHPSATGFGIEFKFNLESPTFANKAQKPQLLPGNEGWSWHLPDGQELTVKFSPALAKIEFEGKKAQKLRAFFFTSIEQGNAQSTMTITSSGKMGTSAMPAQSKRSMEPTSTAQWQPNILDDKASPVDLSFLNANDKPAGKHGFVKAQADNLVFEDGTPIKFWGTNVMANALFSSPDSEIEAHAKRLARLGFNLVRIHHIDSNWVKPNIFGEGKGDTQTLSPDSLKKLDWWIKCLKDQGIYVWLDLHVGRSFTDDDGIDHYDELGDAKTKKNKQRKDKSSAEAKGFNYLNDSIQKQMQAFNQAYLSHVNAYTGLEYKDEPAVFGLLITNENDLTQHFGNLFLPNKGVPQHSALYDKALQSFSDSNGFKAKKTGRAWEMGEPKLFLSDVEHKFNEKMIAHLRGMGAKSMLATTNSWGKMGLFGLPSLTDGNLIDSHSYGKGEEISHNPRFNPGFLSWIGAAQVTGMPLSVTEWNIEPFPTDDRFLAPVQTASIANLQGWDAIMLYGYCQSALGGKAKGSNFSSFNDPAIMGLMPTAALLFRQGHVAPGKNQYELKLSKDDFFYAKQDPTTSKSIRTLLETSRFSVTMPETRELPWLKPKSNSAQNALPVTDANKDFIPEGQNFVQSDTGELKRNWVKGIHTVNTPKSQVASGWIGGETVKLNEVTFNLKTKQAVVAVQSLDDVELKKSRRIFVTALARSTPANGKELPFLSEPVEGDLSIVAPPGLKLFPINPLGEKEKPISTKYSDGAYQIHLDGGKNRFWFELAGN